MDKGASYGVIEIIPKIMQEQIKEELVVIPTIKLERLGEQL